MELTKDGARYVQPAELLQNMDEWVDFLMDHRYETAFEATLGSWELAMNFPDFPWVPGVSVHADPWELDGCMTDETVHDLLLERAKERLAKQETLRIRLRAKGNLTPIDWLTYADGELGSESRE